MKEKTLNISKIFGENLNIEDAVIIRNNIEENLGKNNFVLNFQNIKTIPNNFFSSLLVPLQDKLGFNNVIKHLRIININSNDYIRPFYGTADMK